MCTRLVIKVTIGIYESIKNGQNDKNQMFFEHTI